MTDRPVWEIGPWDGFGPLDGTVTADVCVVGLGGSGLASVAEARTAGLSVVGVDAGLVAGEAAGRNGGFLLSGLPLFYHEARRQFGADTARTVYQATQMELARILESPHARSTGSLRIAADDGELKDISAELAALTADGFEAVAYEGPEGMGLLIPENGVSNPLGRCRGEALALLAEGARLYENSPVTSIQSGRITTPGGAVEAEATVVAVDGRLEVLFPELVGEVRTARLEMLSTEPVEPRFTRPVYTSFGYMYWQQLPGGEIALGGMRDRHLESSWSTEPGPTSAVQADLDHYLDSMGIIAPVTHRWAGHAAYTDDRRPVFREMSPGVWAVGAYSGHGNVLGAVYGRAAVRAATGRGPSPIL